MRPFRPMHSGRFRVSSGSQDNNEAAASAKARTTNARNNSSPPPSSLLSSTQRVHRQLGSAAAEGATSAHSHSALMHVFTVSWAGSRGRRLD